MYIFRKIIMTLRAIANCMKWPNGSNRGRTTKGWGWRTGKWSCRRWLRMQYSIPMLVILKFVPFLLPSLRRLAGPRYVRRFTMFHQVLGWLSCPALYNLQARVGKTTLFLGSACLTTRIWPLLRQFLSAVFNLYSPVLPSWCTYLITGIIYPMLTQCAKFPPFLSCAPSLTWLRNGLLVFDCLGRGVSNLLVFV